MRLSRLPWAPALFFGFIWSTAALGQTLPSLDLRTWRPSVDSNASVVLEPVSTPGSWNWNLGLWSNYTHHPIALRRAGTSDILYRPIEELVAADVVTAIGIGSRAEIGLAVPIYLYQNGSNDLPPAVTSSSRVPTTGLGDIAVSGKASILDNTEGGFGLAALADVSLPTGERTSFMNERGVTATARILADYTLVVANVQASLGYTLRTEHMTWPDTATGGITFGDEIPWSFGFGFRPGVFGIDGENRQYWELAAHGWFPAGPVGPFGSGDPGSSQLTPVLLAASDRISIGHSRDLYALGGGEVGLTNAVGVPTFRVIASIGWAPREHDRDHDGVPDDVDQCPEIAEDRDGFEDGDGCPEIDNDDDGILDTEDACPNQKGEAAPERTKNGCPGLGRGVAGASPELADRDHDGIPDDADKCPDVAADRHGSAEGDGCPEPDTDGDGIVDRVDACPKLPGEPSTDSARHGCPNPDRDGDTYDNDVDQCPDAPEVFNGIQDTDGCPDEGGAPLINLDGATSPPSIRLKRPLQFKTGKQGLEPDGASTLTLRSIALELSRHRDWTLTVGSAPEGTATVSRASVVVAALEHLTHRPGSAEVVGWEAVSKARDSRGGVGLVILLAPIQPDVPSAKSQ